MLKSFKSCTSGALGLVEIESLPNLTEIEFSVDEKRLDWQLLFQKCGALKRLHLNVFNPREKRLSPARHMFQSNKLTQLTMSELIVSDYFLKMFSDLTCLTELSLHRVTLDKLRSWNVLGCAVSQTPLVKMEISIDVLYVKVLCGIIDHVKLEWFRVITHQTEIAVSKREFRKFSEMSSSLSSFLPTSFVIDVGNWHNINGILFPSNDFIVH